MHKKPVSLLTSFAMAALSAVSRSVFLPVPLLPKGRSTARKYRPGANAPHVGKKKIAKAQAANLHLDPVSVTPRQEGAFEDMGWRSTFRRTARANSKRQLQSEKRQARKAAAEELRHRQRRREVAAAREENPRYELPLAAILGAAGGSRLGRQRDNTTGKWVRVY